MQIRDLYRTDEFFCGQVAEGHLNFYKNEWSTHELGSFLHLFKNAFCFFVFCLFDCEIENSNMNAEAQNRNQGFNPGPITYKKQNKKTFRMH